MITAKEAKMNVIRYDNELKLMKKLEDEIFENIKKNSKNGLNQLNVLCSTYELRSDFVKELQNIGFDAKVVIPCQQEPQCMLVIKW